MKRASIRTRWLRLIIVLPFLCLAMTSATFGQNEKARPKPVPATQTVNGTGTDSVAPEVHTVHGKRFPHRGGGSNLIASSDLGDVRTYAGTPNHFLYFSGEPTLQDTVNEITCRSDVVLAGSVLEKTAFLTSKEDWAFTDHVVQVNEVIKDNSVRPIPVNAHIVVARSGGTIHLSNGRVIRVTDESFAPLKVGSSYLLFLKYIPETGGYLSEDGRGSFELQGGKAVKLTTQIIYGEPDDGIDFLNFVRLIRSAPIVCPAKPEVVR